MEPTSLDWRGVMPAMTTPFGPTGEIDHDFARRHAQWMVEAGCTGIIAPGSLGEGNTLRLMSGPPSGRPSSRPSATGSR